MYAYILHVFMYICIYIYVYIYIYYIYTYNQRKQILKNYFSYISTLYEFSTIRIYIITYNIYIYIYIYFILSYGFCAGFKHDLVPCLRCICSNL